MYRNRIKRLLDILLSACGILCLSWLLLLLTIAIKLDSPGPVFFRQKRVGIGKRHFQILKFRTMRIDTPHDMPTHLLHDPEQYITRMGRFLRKDQSGRAAPAVEYPCGGIWRSSARAQRFGTSTTCWPNGISTVQTMYAPG